jgi:cell cycle checkpoint protein
MKVSYVVLMSTAADNQSEWFRDALMDLPPTCTKITLTAIPPDTTHPPELLEATGSSNQRRYHRADVGGFSITAKGDFGQTEVSSHLLPP